MRDSVWAFLEQYDLPVVVGSPVGKSDQSSQVSAWLQGNLQVILKPNVKILLYAGL